MFHRKAEHLVPLLSDFGEYWADHPSTVVTGSNGASGSTNSFTLADADVRHGLPSGSVALHLEFGIQCTCAGRENQSLRRPGPAQPVKSKVRCVSACVRARVRAWRLRRRRVFGILRARGDSFLDRETSEMTRHCASASSSSSSFSSSSASVTAHNLSTCSQSWSTICASTSR